MPKATDANLETVLLNISGSELIYEVGGDAQRGNPLDIVTVVEAHSAETVDGVRFGGKAVARRVLVAWNCHAELVAAAKIWDEGFVNGEEWDEQQLLAWMNKNRAAARAALAKVAHWTTWK